MSSEIRSSAGIAFCGSVMRYAEVERSGSAIRLIRLGNCDFEFNAADELFAAARPSRLDVIKDALSDVFSGTTAATVRAVLPAHVLTSFHTVVPANATEAVRNRQIALEAQTLVGVDADGDLFPAAGIADPDATLIPVFVAHAPRRIAERVRTVGTVFGDVVVEMIPRQTAVHSALNAVQQVTGAARTLVVGAFPGRTEYQFVDGGQRVAEAEFTVEEPGDRAYFSLEVLHRFGVDPSAVEAVWLHGDRVDGPLLDIMNDTWGVRSCIANPGPAVELEEGRLEASFGFEAFMATIGAAVR